MIDREDDGLELYPHGYGHGPAPAAGVPSTRHLSLRELARGAEEPEEKEPPPPRGAEDLFGMAPSSAAAASAPPESEMETKTGAPAAVSGAERAAEGLRARVAPLVREFTERLERHPSVGPDDPVHLLLSCMGVFLGAVEEMTGGLLDGGRALADECRRAAERWGPAAARLEAAAERAERRCVELGDAGRELLCLHSRCGAEARSGPAEELHRLAGRLEAVVFAAAASSSSRTAEPAPAPDSGDVHALPPRARPRPGLIRSLFFFCRNRRSRA